jgi:site-specific recombinase XerD
MDRYADSIKDEFLFPVFSYQKVIKYLKEVMLQLKIKKTITFHSARHTFATTVTLSNGVPIETVSKLLNNKEENQSLTKLRDTLLSKLISGEVRLKEFREKVEQVL